MPTLTLSLLGEPHMAWNEVVLATRETIGLDPALSLWLDVDAFERSLVSPNSERVFRARRAAPNHPTRRAIELLRQTLRLEPWWEDAHRLLIELLACHESRPRPAWPRPIPVDRPVG
jgi:hypothetical protein